MLSRERCQAKVDELRASYAAELQRDQANLQADADSYKGRVLEWVGMGHSGQLGAQVTDARAQLAAVDKLEALIPDALQGGDAERQWVNLANVLAANRADVSAFAGEATEDWVEQQTEKATAETVKSGINTAVGAPLKFVWDALPWWVIVGGLGVGAWVALPLLKSAAGAVRGK